MLPDPHSRRDGYGREEHEWVPMRVDISRQPRWDRADDHFYPIACLRGQHEHPQREVAPKAARSERDGDMTGVHLRPSAQPRVNHDQDDAGSEQCELVHA
jgi:hypothetical protein